MFRSRRFDAFLCSMLAALLAGAVVAQEPGTAPKKVKISEDGLKALKRMQLPKGLTADLWAGEPLLANPIAFCFDEQGRIYVAETFRLHAGVPDNRSHMKWLDDELANRTVADRVAMYKKYKYNGAGPTDRVRQLTSSTPDGKPDSSTIFAEGFNRPEDGLGSGILAHRGNIYFTCIPDLWLLKDTKNVGKADVKKSLQTGYGVHCAFIGHDSHGLKLGPDGKLYFSIGDRGLHVETEGRVVSAPDCGAVLRCNLDGSELEIVHTGLRNPQELAFDKYGNLFTVDNNADGGDQARLVHVVDGADSGWRIGHQYLPKLGTWNSERTWQPHNPDRSSYFVPPLINMINGPSGLTYNPGVTLLPEKYQDNFFICDFRGGSGGSGIYSFTIKAKGSSFELAKKDPFVMSILATDCDFGPDGGFYISDWLEGWGMTGKGRIYKVADPERLSDDKVARTKKLIGDGMAKTPAPALAELLGDDDMRVRLEAQYTLAERNESTLLERAALKQNNQMARIHGVWGLGQIGRKTPKVLESLIPLLEDSDLEVRTATAKVLGEAKVGAAREALVKALKDSSPRVKYHAAVALGRVGSAADHAVLFELLQTNADADPYLRHGVVTGLAGLKDAEAVLAKADTHANASVRLGALLALRKLESPQVAKFLTDTDPKIVLEAARAITDQPIYAGLPELAKILDRPLPDVKLLPANQQEYLLRRAVTAHYRLGGKANALALANFAVKPGVPENVRIEALKLLQQWATPSTRDNIIGVFRPLTPRPDDVVAEAVRATLPRLMTVSDKVRAESVKLAAQHGIREIGPALRTLVADTSKPASLRIETLRALEALKDASLLATAELAIKDEDGRIRHQARRILLAKADASKAAVDLALVLEKASVPEKQGALELLADLKKAEADAIIARWMDALVKKQVPAEIQLDVLEAATRRKDQADVKPLLAAFLGTRAKGDPLAEYRETLAGGDAESGRRIFHDKTELSCLRCHKIQGTGGEVGPDLTGLSKRVKRDYILESLVDPNKQIAKGYETVVLVLTNGQVKTGILKTEDSKEIRLMNAEGQLLTIQKSDVEERNRGPSAMPVDLLQKMNRREIRDLVEYLSGL